MKSLTLLKTMIEFPLNSHHYLFDKIFLQFCGANTKIILNNNILLVTTRAELQCCTFKLQYRTLL